MSDLDGARPALQQLLAEMPDLLVVITVWDWALKGWFKHLTLSHHALPKIPVSLHVPHPSQRNTPAKHEALERLNNAFDLAKRAIQDED